MATMNVSLPEDLKRFVDEHVTAGHYTSASEYIRELLRRDEHRQRLRDAVVAGMRSPIVAEFDDDHRARLSRLATGDDL